MQARWDLEQKVPARVPVDSIRKSYGRLLGTVQSSVFMFCWLLRCGQNYPGRAAGSTIPGRKYPRWLLQARFAPIQDGQNRERHRACS